MIILLHLLTINKNLDEGFIKKHAHNTQFAI